MHPDIYEAIDKIAGKGDRSKKRDRRKRQQAKKRRMQSSAPSTGPVERPKNIPSPFSPGHIPADEPFVPKSSAPAPKPAQAAPAPKPAPAATSSAPASSAPASSAPKAKAPKVKPFALSKNMKRGLGLGAAAAALGGAGYLYNRHKKTASIAEYSVLFDKVASGDLGEHTRQALYGICQTFEAPVTAEKTASVYDASNLSEIDARKARLDQLLKR